MPFATLRRSSLWSVFHYILGARVDILLDAQPISHNARQHIDGGCRGR
jgi:hypothetical protein